MNGALSCTAVKATADFKTAKCENLCLDTFSEKMIIKINLPYLVDL